MSTQLDPVQRRHWYAYVTGAVPIHVPGAAVRVRPSTARPLIVGASAFVGAAAVITSAAE